MGRPRRRSREQRHLRVLRLPSQIHVQLRGRRTNQLVQAKSERRTSRVGKVSPSQGRKNDPRGSHSRGERVSSVARGEALVEAVHLVQKLTQQHIFADDYAHIYLYTHILF